MKTLSFDKSAAMVKTLAVTALVFVSSLASAQSGTKLQPSPELNGIVVDQDGNAVVGAYVYASMVNFTKTDANGRFRLVSPGKVVKVSDDNYEIALVFAAEGTRDVRVQMKPVRETILAKTCGTPKGVTRRIGWGQRGLQFDVSRQLNVKGGHPDVDYVAYAICHKGSKKCLELWFGPYAFSPEPEDELLLRSVNISQRTITKPEGVIGRDFRGQLRDGTNWRHTAVGLEGARYENVSQDAAKMFDEVIDSFCLIPYRP